LVGSIFHMTRKIVSEMTYNVSMGTLNPTIPYLTLTLTFDLWPNIHWWARYRDGLYPCAKFGVFSFSRFGFIVRTHRQTHRQNHRQRRYCYTHATTVRLSNEIHINWIWCIKTRSKATQWELKKGTEDWCCCEVWMTSVNAYKNKSQSRGDDVTFPSRARM